MGLINSIKSRFLDKGPDTSQTSSARGKRSGKRIRNPPNRQNNPQRGPQGPGRQQTRSSSNPGGPGRGQGGQPRDEFNAPPSGPGSRRNGPQDGPDRFREDDLSREPQSPRFDENPGGRRNPQGNPPQNTFEDELDFESPMDQGVSQRQVRRPQQQGGRDRARAEDLPSPRHYNMDLPLDDAPEEDEEIRGELHRLEEQNDRIIQLLQQIKNGLNQY